MFGVIRDIRIRILRAVRRKAASLHLDDVDKADKLLVLTNGKMQRCNALTEAGLQSQQEFAIARLVIVHIGHKENARQAELLAEFPCLDGAGLHARLAVNDNHGCIRRCDCLFHLADEIEIPRGIKEIDLNRLCVLIRIFDRNERCADGEAAALLFLIVVAER